jgi:urea transport system permease protein
MARRGFINWAVGGLTVLVCLFAPWAVTEARAAVDLSMEMRAVASGDSEQAATAIEHLKAADDLAALPALQALDDGNLEVDAAGNTFIKTQGGLKPAVPQGPAQPTGALKSVDIDNTLRRALLPALAALKLASPDREIRLDAAEELAKRPTDDVAVIVRAALAKEKDSKIRGTLALAVAQLDLASEDPARRLSAVELIRQEGSVDFKADLERMLGKSGSPPTEKDPRVLAAARAALTSIDTRVMFIGMVGNLFYGLSLGSVLLLAALGLAITFGLMRVINMAHGEMLMIGAYTTYVVQNFFQKNLPHAFDWYIVAAIPAAFIVCFAVGAALERTVIQFLYGRPLETLLATWGISLCLIQTVRTIFGAQNVTVANPAWLSGGYELLPGVVLTYSRLAVIVFAIVVCAFVWLWMNKTPVGLRVRAVTQNREMAAAMGIATRKVDLGTFGLGSGIAGLGGVALSQLGNVGPELGQGYIVDSFMVVVLGGVGKLVGTIAGAMGLGIVNKLLEPLAGAVLGKIIILGLIILFIQKRPQGIFALKGRAAEV